ncbi:MAG: hypothetical protein ACXWLR_05170 [Myxococcales bacterium]
MASVPIHIPVHIRVHDRGGYPPDITVEPQCVHARTRDTLDWDLQGGGRFALELLDGQTPFGSDFRLVSDSDGCCSETIYGYAEPGTYHYGLQGQTAILAPGSPTPFAMKGCLEIVIR